MSTTIKSSADGLQAIIQVNGVDKATVDSSGNLIVTGKVSQAAQSMVRVNTANGYGSTNTKIRRFTTTVTNQGSDITYADSATLGGSFTINTSGVYSISYSDGFNIAEDFGPSLNTATPAVGITTIPTSEVLIRCATPGAAYYTSTAWVGYLPAASIVRAHTNTAPAAAAGNGCHFTITRVA